MNRYDIDTRMGIGIFDCLGLDKLNVLVWDRSNMP